jgi:hypothetical protein
MNVMTHARISLAALGLVLGAALAAAPSANAQAVASRPEASQRGFPTGEHALLGRSAGLTVQVVALTESSSVTGPEAMLHRFSSTPPTLGGIAETTVPSMVCGEEGAGSQTLSEQQPAVNTSAPQNSDRGVGRC